MRAGPVIITGNLAIAALLHRLVCRLTVPNRPTRHSRTMVCVFRDRGNVATESVRYFASDAVDFLYRRFSRCFLDHFQATPLVYKSPEWEPRHR
jgi:hypothetical protein